MEYKLKRPLKIVGISKPLSLWRNGQSIYSFCQQLTVLRNVVCRKNEIKLKYKFCACEREKEGQQKPFTSYSKHLSILLLNGLHLVIH